MSVSVSRRKAPFLSRLGQWLLVDLPYILTTLVGTILLLLLAFAGLAFLLYAWRAISFPYPIDYGEGPILDQALHLARFQNIYRLDLSVPPFTVANYPPLFPLLQVPFVLIWGPAFWYGRLISALCIGTACVLCGLILYALTHDRVAAVITGLTLPVIPYVTYWGAFDRVDALALALSLAALYVLVRWPARRLSLVGTACLLTSAVYAKQSYALAAPLAAFVWLLSGRPRRRSLALVGLTATLVAGVSLALNAWTRGGFFFNVVTANANQYKLGILFDKLREMGSWIPYLLVTAAVFLGGGARSRQRVWWLVAPYLGGAFLSALTIGKVGSNVNYLFELSAALSLAVGAFIAWQRGRPWLIFGVVVVLALQSYLLLRDWPRQTRYHGYTEDRLASRSEQAALLQVVHNAPGTVLADEYMGTLVIDGRPLWLQPFEMTQLALGGRWDQQPLLAAIQRKEFALILIYEVDATLHRDRWTPEMLRAIEENYVPTAPLGHAVIYVPEQ